MGVLEQHFTQAPILDHEQSASIVEQIEARRDLWTCHHPEIPLFTLGISGFLADSPDQYLATARAVRPKLQADFAELFSLVRQLAETRLGCTVLDHPSGAHPGFLILGDHDHFTTPFASAHFDVQHRNLDWPLPPDTGDVLSFTLPIELPRQGGALEVWDLTDASLDGLDEAARNALVNATPHVALPHAVGAIVVHRGNILHRIAPAPRIAPGDRRITLQGHIARAGDDYYWYW